MALLNHLDKEKKGSISVNEFAQGLQDIKNSSKVGASTPIHQPLRRVYSEVSRTAWESKLHYIYLAMVDDR